MMREMNRMNETGELRMEELEIVNGGVLTDNDRDCIKGIAKILKLQGFTMDEAIASIRTDFEDYEESVELFKSVYAAG